LPAFLLTDTALALLRGWSVRTEPEAHAFRVAGILGGPVLLGLVLPWTRTWMRRRSAQLTLFGIVFLLACLAVEAIARWALGPPDFWFHRRRPHQQRPHRPAEGLLPGVSGPSVYSTNEHGIRGPALPPRDEAERFLCIGGSTTECLYLDDSEAWPQLLMEGLARRPGTEPLWVGNVGKSGYATSDHVQFLETSALVGQVDCVVAYVGANDHAHALMRRPLRTPDAKLAPLWMRSHLLQGIRRVVETGAGLVRRQRQAEDGSQYRTWRRRRQAHPVVHQPPDLDADLRDYAANLRRMIVACRRHGVRLVFVTQAVLWRDGLAPEERALLWMGLTDRGALDPGTLRSSLERFNATLRAVATAEGVEVVDASALSGQAAHFYDDMHLTEAGARALADLLVAHFRAHP
jgi:lysophospholipase L1-like esterase